MATATIFSETQLSSFLIYIGIPPSDPLHNQRFTGHAPTDLHFLNQLHIHTLSTIPYENLSLHYNSTHTIVLNSENHYQKTVGDARGRGGYCMENMIFYSHILRGLGFRDLYLAPVRMRPRVDGVPTGDFSGWVHVVIILTLSDSTRYSIDVGFGGDCPTAPIPLIENRPQQNLGNQDVRLIRDHLPAQLLRTEATKHWIYQYRNNKSADQSADSSRNGETRPGPRGQWNSFYAFTEYEAMEPDFANLNWYAGAHPASFQTFMAIVVKFLKRPVAADPDSAPDHDSKTGVTRTAGDYEIYGKRMLVDGTIKENLGGKTRIVMECKTEEERIEGLKKWFGMRFTDEEREGIKGWNTALPGDGSEREETAGLGLSDRGAAAPIGGVVVPGDASRGMTEIWHVHRGANFQYNFMGRAE